MEGPRLSKSRYVAGMQCHLRLWNDCFARDLAAEPDDVAEARFRSGEAIGRLALERHPGGVYIDGDYPTFTQALADTEAAVLDDGVPAIFEATFVHDGVLVRVDILERLPGGRWRLLEVKSSTSAKEVHLLDVTIQAWVLAGCGLDVAEMAVLHLNREYVYAGGEHDVGALFTETDVTAEVEDWLADVEGELGEMRGMLGEAGAPDVEPGPQCDDPYPCPYAGSCWADVEILEHPVWELPRIGSVRVEDMLERGIEQIKDIPEDEPLTEAQRRVRDCVVAGEAFVSPGLGAALSDIEYPVHHLDFETFGPALPRYAGTRPYESLAFQWSNHTEHADGTVDHHEFLLLRDEDPRPALADALLTSLGDTGSICVYTSYEARVIRSLAEALPGRADALRGLLGRLWDVYAIIKEHYYHPDFAGSWSLKKVLPVLVPDLGYEGLAIQQGMAAAGAYERALETDDAAERETLRAAMLEYCKLDTLGLVRLREALKVRFTQA